MPPYRAPVVRKPRPRRTPAAKKPKVRVKAHPKPEPAPVAGDSKRKAYQAPPQPEKAKLLQSGKGVGGAITAGAKHVRPEKKAAPGVGARGKTTAQVPTAKQRLQRALQHPGEQEGGIDKAVHTTTRKILVQTSRPNHAIAAATRAAIHGDDPLKAAGRGVRLKDSSTFGDVLGDLGVHNRIVKAVGGTVLDIGTDPTTYLTLGAGSVGRKAVEESIAKGLTEKEATRGIKVGFKAHIPGTDKGVHLQVPGVTRATAAVGRKAKKTRAGQKASQANTHVRDTLNETIAPDVTPSYRTRAEHEDIRSAERVARAKIQTGERKIVRRGKALNKAVTEKEASQIRAAIERKIRPGGGRASIEDLPSLKQQQVAENLSKSHANRLAAKERHGIGSAFVPEGPEDAQAFFPRATTKKAEKTVNGAPARRPIADTRRTVRLPFDEARTVVPKGTYVEDARQAETIDALKDNRSVHLAQLWRDVKETGRKLHPMSGIAPDEAVYEFTETGPRVVAEASEPKRIAEAALSPGKYVILNKKSVDNVAKRIPTRSEHKIVRGYDQAQGRIKSFQTVYAPGYHARNLVGDSLNAWLHDTTGKSFLQSRKALKAQGAKNKFERSAEAVTAAGPKAAKAQKYLNRTVNVGKAGKMKVGDLIRLAEEHGAINTGQVAGEIRDLTGDAEVRRRLLKGGKTKVSGREHKFSEYRENLPRLATFRQGLADGMTPELAASHSLKAHIDYQDLTKFERVGLRRAFQFYTFFARNSRIQATRLVQRPGKFAAIQHVLDETAKAAGFQDYDTYADQLQDYEQKGIPLPIRSGGHVYPIFLNPPTTDLSQLSTNLKEQALQNFASRLTTFKTIGELVTNRSIFFGLEPIRKGEQLTPAPQEVQYLPDVLKKKLGVDRILSHGKWVWGWDPRVDYAFRVLPQSNIALQTTKPTPDDRGLNTNLSIGVSALTGVKIGPDRRKDAATSRLYDERTKLDDRLHFLRTQKGLSADHPNAEYKRLSQRLKVLNATLAPPKKKAASNPFDGPGHKTGSNPFDGPAGGSSAPNPFDGG